MRRVFSITNILLAYPKIRLSILLVLISITSIAQTSFFVQDDWRSNYFAEVYQLDLPKSSRIIENKGGAYQFAVPITANKSISLGDEDKSQDGFYHYFYSIKVTDAQAINFTLKGLGNADVTSIYVNTETHTYGPYFPNKNNFDITPFPNYFTDELTLEIITKRMLAENNEMLYKIGVVYDISLLKSSDCNVDINCNAGQDWQDVKKSVVRIYFNNGYLCTGTILNNTLNNERPYLLTANHCISTSQSAANAIFSFNYEAPYCDAPSYEYPGLSSNRLVGAYLRATKDDAEGKLDFTLLELDDPIPEHFDVHFAGWSASKKQPHFVAGIHHPGGDVKKIAIDYDRLIIGTFSNEYDDNSFWRVLKWDVGVTEGGSSGSAIFNEWKQLVGDLTGGEATCEYPFNDFYSRFDLAFDKYEDSTQQLKYWLDPAGLDVQSWMGIPNDQINDSLKVFVYPNPAHQRIQIYSPTLSGFVNIKLFDTNGLLVWDFEQIAAERILFVEIPANLLGLYYMRVESNNYVFKKKMVFY